MKKQLIIILLALIILPGSFVFDGHDVQAATSAGWKETGAFIGGALDTVIIPGDHFGMMVIPGKLDFIGGYQFNPYVSLIGDLWTVWGVVYGVEAGPKINFTRTKFSPYLKGSVGIGFTPFLSEDDETGIAAAYYGVGGGLDMHLWKKGTLFVETNYRSAMEAVTPTVGIAIGYRYIF